MGGAMRFAVPMLDLPREHAGIQTELREAFERVAASGRFILGEEVERFEDEVARFLGVGFAVGVSSGTDAVLCALTALELERGDEVITTPFSFIATAEAIVRAGATPRFVDIDPVSLNLDLDQVAAAIGPRTRAILPVHLYGEPVAMSELLRIAERHGVPVVEDAAQAFGATVCGRRAGTCGALGCFSFFPSKPLGALGDGGLVVTSDPSLAARCRALRSHGRAARGRRFERVGGNFRLDALQAACLRVKLPHVESALARRRHHARAYTQALRSVSGLRTPIASDGSAWALYTVRVADGRRDALAAWLGERGIETAIHYEVPLHREPAVANACDPRPSFPVADAAAREVLSLPLFPSLTEREMVRVVGALRDFFGLAVHPGAAVASPEL
jgi:dTDP-4-amino-4,6-dideoxygalactose transaminase